MDKADLVLRLRTVAAKAQDLGQMKAHRELTALVQKLSAKYYFLVNSGGYGLQIPDNEYVEFPDEQSVVEYVKEYVLSDVEGQKPGENLKLQQELDFQSARKTLLEIGEFGPLATPLTPPNTMVGSRLARAPRDLEDLKEQLHRVVTKGEMEIIDGVSIDVDQAALLLKFLAVVNPAFAGAAMAMGLASLLHKAYEWSQGSSKESSLHQRYSNFEEVREELEQRFDKWKYDPRFLTVLQKVLKALTPQGRSQLLAEEVPVMVDRAMEMLKEWQLKGEGREFESFVASRESAFFKRLAPYSELPEDLQEVNLDFK